MEEENIKTPEILDVGKIYKRYVQDWKIWVEPLMNGTWWYSKDFYEETMEGFENVSGGGMKIVFIYPMIGLDR